MILGKILYFSKVFTHKFTSFNWTRKIVHKVHLGKIVFRVRIELFCAMQVLSNQLIDNFPWIHKNKFDMETKIGFDRSQHIIKIWNSKFCELFYLFNSKKSFQKHCKVKELLKNNFYQFIVLDLKPDLIIKMLATNARPTRPTNTYSNHFQRNFAFGFRRSSPKMCDECCSKIKHVFRMLMAT